MTMQPNNELWVQGFMEHCAAADVPMEQVPVLLKAAALRRMQADPNFMAGAESQLKQAGLNKEAFLPLLAGALGLGYLGYKGIQGAGQSIRQGWRGLRGWMDPTMKGKYMVEDYDKAVQAQNAARQGVTDLAKPYQDMLQRVGAGGPAGGTGVPGADGHINTWRYL